MIYREYPPQLALQDYIQCFWKMSSSSIATPSKQVNHRILPDCCSDIIFDFTGIRGRFPAYVVGTMTSPILFTTSGHVDMLGIRFKPAGIQSFLQTPVEKCTDLALELGCFWGAKGTELWERLREQKEIYRRISMLESYLLKQHGPNMKLDPYVHFCVKFIENHHGHTTIGKELEKRVGLSSRQIERKFKFALGVAPKTFSRLVRFQNIVRQAREIVRPDWSFLAMENGYSDQSHLIRDFREFSGITPHAFLAEKQ